MAPNLQQAIVQGTLLYAAGLTWNGRSGMEGEYQAFINRMGRATLGAFRSTPLSIVAGESGLTPARVLLDHRQTPFTQRHLARPQGHDDPEEIMSRWVSALAERLRTATLLQTGDRVEMQEWGRFRNFPGSIVEEE